MSLSMVPDDENRRKERSRRKRQMTTQLASLMSAAGIGRRKIATLIALAALPFAVSAQITQPTPATPPSGWMVYGQAISMDTSRYGYPDWALPNGGYDLVSTQNQELTTVLNLGVYKNAISTGDGYDYYLVTGDFIHAITNGGTLSNWLSVGIYGTQMALTITGNGATFVDSAPTSSSGSTTSGWSVGGNIGVAGTAANAGGSFSYSVSDTMPDITFSNISTTDGVTYTAYLPGPTSSRVNPEPASNAGYDFYSAVIFKVVQGSGLTRTVTSSAGWEYDFTRGISYETYNAWSSGVFNVDFTNKTLVQNSSGLCLGVQNNLLQNGQPVTLQTCNGGSGQSWSYTAASQLQNGLSGTTTYCLDSSHSLQTVGTGMVVGVCNNLKTSQKFKLGQIWQLDQSYARSAETNSGAFGGFFVDSPTSFTNTPATYGQYPTASPTSSVIETITSLVVSSGTSDSLGTQVTLQNPKANSGLTGVSYDDELNVQNHFFTLK
jgi:hypothetical protein